jgi:pseudaminic acid cytidylyltransferase
MGNVAIILARGGSKRISRKNILPFLGKPIIAYTIETAIASKLFDEVMVSTDDDEIRDIAMQYGAKVPFLRSSENASDFATTIDVVKEVQQTYFEKFNKEFENICCLYATSPFTTIKDLKAGLTLLEKSEAQTVFPIMQFSYPIQRSLSLSENGIVNMIQPEHLNTRTQDLEKSFHDAGQWYWMKKDVNSLFTEASKAIVLSEMEGQDIDTVDDWKLAELKYELLKFK